MMNRLKLSIIYGATMILVIGIGAVAAQVLHPARSTSPQGSGTIEPALSPFDPPPSPIRLPPLPKQGFDPNSPDDSYTPGIEDPPILIVPDATENNRNKRLYLVVIPVVVAVVLAIGFFIYRLRTRAQRNKALAGAHLELEGVGRDEIEVPFFEFDVILRATNRFSNSNILGQGGFGPVYKGTFSDDQELAVKRLSRTSRQGLEEFKNEVLVIAKLQHRNLVKLMGYSITEEEKVLLYEYMPNKSLDTFIFDRTLCLLLNWEKRLDIILGIARGVLYLHQDSRLRIIHRDLKISNILLDGEMQPKVSDFGLARICGGTQLEGSTNRVVGTYGYMAPEYALEGIFSVKSDVYSFGVILLEMISGKKNSGFLVSDDSLSFIGDAWRLWNENKVQDFLDNSLCGSADQVSRCMQVGLLCVQEEANDRPTMSSVVTMLVGESPLPPPRQPTLGFRRYESGANRLDSINEMSISTQEGR